jgi:hypothetical protein
MPISTVDVVTNVDPGRETQNTGSAVVYCTRTGNYVASSAQDVGISYEALESKYGNRFDDVTYYTLGNQVIVGA